MRELLLFVILIFSVLSSGRILMYDEEILVVVCLVGFVLFCQNTLSNFVKTIFEARSEAIQTDLQHFLTIQETLWFESKEQHELLLSGLRSNTEMIAQSFLNEMIKHCAPLYEQTVYALLHQKMELQLKALVAIQEHSCLRERDKIVSCFRFSVGAEFASFPGQPSIVFSIEKK